MLFCKAIEKTNSLKTLDFKNSSINQGKIVPEILYLLEDLLPNSLITNTSLLELKLEGNQFTDKGLLTLSKVIEVNKTLTSLDLTNNLITDVGIFNLALALEKNKTLKTLILNSKINLLII